MEVFGEERRSNQECPDYITKNVLIGLQVGVTPLWFARQING